MNGPAKNRLHDYEAGWLTFLVKTGMATETEARDAMNRVAVEAAEDARNRRESRSRRRRKKPEGE